MHHHCCLGLCRFFKDKCPARLDAIVVGIMTMRHCQWDLDESVRQLPAWNACHMSDWTEDPLVISAVQTFNTAHSAWMRVRQDAGTGHVEPPPEHVAIYLRMRAADRAYEVARDDAIDRSRARLFQRN
jgi:hypothetical protein